MNKKYRILAGLYALLFPKVFSLSLLPPDDGAGGGDDAISPLLGALFGTDDKQPEVKEEPSNVGMTLQQAIAAPSEDEKKAAEDAAKAKEEEAKAKADAEKKAAEEAAAEAAKKAAETPAPIKGTKRKTQAEVDAEAKAKADAEAAEKQSAAKQDWEKALLDEERDQLDMARFAEKKFGEKYKGLSAKVEKFIRENAAKVEAEDFDADSDEYRAWVEKNRPNLTTAEIRIIERARGEDIAEEKAKKATDDVLDRTFRMVETPRVKAEADAYYAKAASEVMPEDVQAAFKESPAKAREQFPFEYGIVEAEMNAHADAVEEMLALTRVNPDTRRVLKPYDPKNPVHVAAFQLVQAVDETFKKTGGADLVRNGRTFLPRAELARIPAEQRGKYWTFNSREIAERSTAMVKTRIADRIKSEHERMAKMGFERRKPVAAAAPEKKDDPKPTPAPRPAPFGGGAAGDGPKSAAERLMMESGMMPS
jgi:hypothetical protein